jgi:hypothetical protein
MRRQYVTLKIKNSTLKCAAYGLPEDIIRDRLLPPHCGIRCNFTNGQGKARPGAARSPNSMEDTTFVLMPNLTATTVRVPTTFAFS